MGRPSAETGSAMPAMPSYQPEAAGDYHDIDTRQRLTAQIHDQRKVVAGN